MDRDGDESARHRGTRARRVVLFADCFTAYNEPEIGVAAATVLRRLGYQIQLLPRGLGGQWGGCCGRAMISGGLLDDAVEAAERTFEMLRPAVEDDGVEAILVCEPSCLSAFADDWLQLRMRLPIEDRRRLAAKAMLVEDFVEKRWDAHPSRPEVRPATAEVVLHGHCHQKALWGAETSAGLLRRLVGPRLRVLDSGCCGMAGSFGYTEDRYDLSMRIGDLSVFPPVCAAATDAVIVAPGTSCRHQIRDGTGRHALHPIELAARMFVNPATGH
jgi:Fe-S oxidoreductase